MYADSFDPIDGRLRGSNTTQPQPSMSPFVDNGDGYFPLCPGSQNGEVSHVRSNTVIVHFTTSPNHGNSPQLLTKSGKPPWVIPSNEFETLFKSGQQRLSRRVSGEDC